MKNSLSFLFVCLLNLSLSIYPLAACADSLETSDNTNTISTTNNNDVVVNLRQSAFSNNFINTFSISLNYTVKIIDIINGTALIKNTNNVSRKATKGMVLEYGDLIDPSKGAIVLIKCGNQERQVRRVQGLGEICPDIVGNRGNYGSDPNIIIRDSKNYNSLNMDWLK